jgi:hypothetical protein
MPSPHENYDEKAMTGLDDAGRAAPSALLLFSSFSCHSSTVPAGRLDRIDVPDWYHLDRGREWIVQLDQAWGKPEKAAEWRKK